MFDRAKGTIRAIAMLCVAVTCMVCLQSTLIALDRIEHALEIEHDANPLAGTVHYCVGAADVCDHSGGPMHPVSHSHSGDAAANVLVETVPSLVMIDFKTAALPVAETEAGPGLRQITPDRPPKA